MGLLVRELGGVVTGQVWSGLNVPGLGPPFCRGTLTGSMRGSSVALHLQGPPGAEAEWDLEGLFEQDALRGELRSRSHSWRGYPFEAARVDAIPSGEAEIRVSGAETWQATAMATFGYDFYTGDPALVVDATGPHRCALVVEFCRRHRYRPEDDSPDLSKRSPPARGKYRLGGASPRATLTVDPDDGARRKYHATGGTVRIERSDRITLTGSLDLSASGPAAEGLRVSGRFNAGCTFGDW